MKDDAIFAIAEAIKFGFKWIGTGLATDGEAPIGFLGDCIKSAGQQIASSIAAELSDALGNLSDASELAEPIRMVADSGGRIADALVELAAAVRETRGERR
jgi:hypothetical protein